ncbi:helix-turn-helix transcriptional regulator [Ornithinimicrobium pratense]|uniref:YafY family transcriptional regulator n=1 Tax=Ornithinimicrobium pratense TaxID=2593973 RepID=A0A5J6V4Y8_9MICO|nr:YafY family protein [Ornithinimicrobium pratense]QFG68657.1 YafY family transcriptional regulator [Ornithinimicrobium pratense]
MARPSPAAAKTERLLNLVIALLHTRQPLSRARLREAVPDYAGSSDEAFERMFERDKDELRALGVPLRTEPIDPFFDDEPGYRIDQREYALPEIDFAPDEVAVLGLAARSWSQASLAGPAAQALRKLEAAGLVKDETSVAGIEPLLHTREPAFEPVRDAVLSRTPLRFDYRGGSGDLTERHVQPWGLTSWHGRWYLTAHDLDRDAPRVFRLDRIAGTPTKDGRKGGYDAPTGHDAAAMIRSSVGEEDGETTTVRLLVREGTAASLRRRGQVVAGGPDANPDAGSAPGPVAEGWDLLDLPVGSLPALAKEVCGAGPDVVVVAPEELRSLVSQRLETVAHAHGPGAGPAPDGAGRAHDAPGTARGGQTGGVR